MAINKTITKPPKSHGGLRNTIEYVLRDEKVKDGYVYMTGPSPESLDWDNVYRAFLEEKKIWNKDVGRMCAHNIISFHKDELITAEQALEFGKEFAEKWFSQHQNLIAVHQDKEHIHIHLITNTVSYVDGHKLHTSKHDLDNMKQMTNKMCIEHGLTIATKGKHFDGSAIDEGTIISWTKDKYQALLNKVSTILLDCIAAVITARSSANCKEDFINSMSEQGWDTTWSEKRKHITFTNIDGQKIRDSNLSKTFNIDISKEGLAKHFSQNAEKHILSKEYSSLQKNLQDAEDLKFTIEQRIDMLNEYIESCSRSDETAISAQSRVHILSQRLKSLNTDIEQLRKAINESQVENHTITDVPIRSHEVMHEMSI